MVPRQTRCSHFCDVKRYRGNGKALQKRPYFGLAERSVSSFLFLKFNQHAKIKLSGKLKRILWSGSRATLNN